MSSKSKTTPGWQPLNLLFKQGYDGAYGYLDSCGEFVKILRERFGFYCTEPTPTGCNLELADERMQLTVNTSELTLNYEANQNDKLFLEVADFASKAAIELFEPFEVHRNDLVARYFRYEESNEKSNEYSISLFGNEAHELSKKLSLQPSAKEIKMSFRSGSYELDVQTQPIVLMINGRNAAMAQSRSSKAQSTYIDKVREAVTNPPFQPGYGVMLILNLSEADPAPGGLTKQLALLRKHSETVIPLL